MKNILFCLSIASALFFIHSFCAQDVKRESGFTITQQDYPVVSYPSDKDNPLFDVCFEDVFDDDDDSESEGKKLSSSKIADNSPSLIAQNFPEHDYKKKIPATSLFPRRVSLLIFICVFRI
jgi:hypothetical protein